ncbi:MATE family efflux transporter [uncultured Sharpea sp.]|uniref:MATE family efflux transporter n=1 Tax=uncultured Sharpea sp. TaxID=1112738 RepID=UPI00258D98CE|nr:MATE family efflux transporter [uncultured Sharpea sp.]
MQRDLTKGNLLKNIVVFSLPFLLSYFLQTLYGMADLFIVGQFDGASVISGVAIGSQVMHMITVMLVGVATGGAVMIGRYVGAHDKENISKTIGNTITLFVIIAAILTALLLLLVSPIVTIMSTPKEAIVETSNYLKICCGMCCQYCLGLLLYWHTFYACIRCGPSNHYCTSIQCHCGYYYDCDKTTHSAFILITEV